MRQAVLIVSADLGLVPLQLRILQDFMWAPLEHKRIHLRALEAIEEICRMTDSARATLGLEPRARMQISMEIETRVTPVLVKLADQVAEALQNMGDFWAYGMAKADGAEPTEEDDRAVHTISTCARIALDTYLEHRRMMQMEH